MQVIAVDSHWKSLCKVKQYGNTHFYVKMQVKFACKLWTIPSDVIDVNKQVQQNADDSICNNYFTVTIDTNQ